MICVGYILCQKFHPTWKISTEVDAPIPSSNTESDDACKLRRVEQEREQEIQLLNRKCVLDCRNQHKDMVLDECLITLPFAVL